MRFATKPFFLTNFFLRSRKSERYVLTGRLLIGGPILYVLHSRTTGGATGRTAGGVSMMEI